MAKINPSLIPNYEAILAQNPNDKTFALLAQGYLEQGSTLRALYLAEKGVQANPLFAAGRLVLAKILYELERYLSAYEEVNRSLDLEPKSLMAYRLQAKCLKKLRRPKELLSTYKMILFLNPKDNEASELVKTLSPLSAEDYEKGFFEAMKPYSQDIMTLEKYISVADALLTRNQLREALERLRVAEKNLGPHIEIERRMTRIEKAIEEGNNEEAFKPELKKEEKLKKLQSLLSQVQMWKQRTRRHR